MDYSIICYVCEEYFDEEKVIRIKFSCNHYCCTVCIKDGVDQCMLCGNKTPFEYENIHEIDKNNPEHLAFVKCTTIPHEKIDEKIQNKLRKSLDKVYLIEKQLEKYYSLYFTYNLSETNKSFYKQLEMDMDEMKMIRQSIEYSLEYHFTNKEKEDTFTRTDDQITRITRFYTSLYKKDDVVPHMYISTSYNNINYIAMACAYENQLEEKYPESSNKMIEFCLGICNKYRREWEIYGLEYLPDGTKFLIYCLDIGYITEVVKKSETINFRKQPILNVI